MASEVVVDADCPRPPSPGVVAAVGGSPPPSAGRWRTTAVVEETPSSVCRNADADADAVLEDDSLLFGSRFDSEPYVLKLLNSLPNADAGPDLRLPPLLLLVIPLLLLLLLWLAAASEPMLSHRSGGGPAPPTSTCCSAPPPPLPVTAAVAEDVDGDGARTEEEAAIGAEEITPPPLLLPLLLIVCSDASPCRGSSSSDDGCAPPAAASNAAGTLPPCRLVVPAAASVRLDLNRFTSGDGAASSAMTSSVSGYEYTRNSEKKRLYVAKRDSACMTALMKHVLPMLRMPVMPGMRAEWCGGKAAAAADDGGVEVEVAAARVEGRRGNSVNPKPANSRLPLPRLEGPRCCCCCCCCCCCTPLPPNAS